MTERETRDMPITPESLMTLEAYAKARKDFKAKVMPHRRLRTVHVGEHVTVQFEDELTIRYQIQEMLRIEKIFEAAGIEEELEVYGPLVPDGTNWKATMMLEYPDVDQRKRELGRLIAIEARTYVQVDGLGKVYAIADEDLARDTEDKTSSVHFLRFEFTPAMIAAIRAGRPTVLGIDHPHYTAAQTISVETLAALAQDLR